MSKDVWYRPSHAGCASGSGTCTVTLGTPIKPGRATWKVLAWNGSGYGPWSDGRDFSVEIADPSALTPQPSAPAGTVATPYPAYTWASVAGAVSYRLSIGINGGPASHWWFSSAAAGCVSTSECAATPSTALQNGTAVWQVQAWTANGHGDWSEAIPLTVTIPAPAAPTLVSPVGSTSATAPFVWSAAADAALYFVRISDSTGVRVERWLSPDEVACAGAATTCTFTTGVALSSGAGTWQVLAWNPTGYSPWSAPSGFVVP